jgi:DNA-binding GntR family transcriptional regulator
MPWIVYDVRVTVNRDHIARPEPLRTSVHRRVVGLMTSGELEPGQTITEAGLSKSLGVSRTPVREALLQLEAEGVLQSTPARGFTVRDLSPTEAAELFPILASLESLAVRLSPKKPDLAHLQNLDHQLTAATDPVERWHLDSEFHEFLTDGCPNLSLRTMIRQLRVSLSRYEIEFMRRAGRDWEHAKGPRHAAILDALKEGDEEGLDIAITQNWQDSLDAVKSWLKELNPTSP